MTTEQTTPEGIAAQRDTFVDRLSAAALAAMDIATVHIGDRLGLYRALADKPATSAELAARTETAERYVREWLEQQAVTGILEIANPDAEAAARRYHVPPGRAEVLLDQDSLHYLAPLVRMTVGLMGPVQAIIDAFQSGGGVPYEVYGADVREAQADINRPQYLQLLGRDWLPRVPDVHARLQADPPARVADIGCGAGWSSIAIAQAYPKVRVDGFDRDAPSMALARANAAAGGVADRVMFHVHDAATALPDRGYDLVVAFEMIHDMAQPVEALRAMRAMVAEDGAVIVMDERAKEHFMAPGDDLDRSLYSASVLCCLPTGMADQPSAGTGTVMRPATFRRYALEAGFRDVEILPIEHDSWRFYRLH